MSKDEYLITDAPLKALTVFAMPIIQAPNMSLVTLILVNFPSKL